MCELKVAVVGSRDLQVKDLGAYLPAGTAEIISGGSRGIDTCAREYAKAQGIKLTEFRPDYGRYKKAAPLIRNRAIVEAADRVLAMWDGRSHGTAHTIDLARKLGKPVEVITVAPDGREEQK